MQEVAGNATKSKNICKDSILKCTNSILPVSKERFLLLQFCFSALILLLEQRQKKNIFIAHAENIIFATPLAYDNVSSIKDSVSTQTKL